MCVFPDIHCSLYSKNGHFEETGKDKILDFEREYLAIHPDLPEDYKKKKEDFFANSFTRNSKNANSYLLLYWDASKDRIK